MQISSKNKGLASDIIDQGKRQIYFENLHSKS